MISLRDVVTGFGNRDPLAEVWRRDLRGGGSSAEITGTLPLSFSGRGKPLTDYLISGNTLQNGTPTPEAPVDVAGSGVRTGNLTESYIINCNIQANGTLNSNPDFNMFIAKVEQGKTYCADVFLLGGYFYNKPTIGNVSYDGQRLPFVASPFVSPIDGYLAFRKVSTETTAMMNEGNKLLPYEPYGYKLPLTVNGTEYPIYLGQVSTTRRIKKLVLTGEENWSRHTDTGTFALAISGSDAAYLISGEVTCICTHYPAQNNTPSYSQMADKKICMCANSSNVWIRDTDYSTSADFKSYLAAQYAAGTPVTVWYILAEPDTSIVNEPLMKIGGYADTISFAQAEVVIPTVNGANVLDMTSTVKPSEVYIKGKGIKPTNDPNFENGG